MAGPSDEALFERYRGGDRSAFRELIERHYDDLMRFLLRMTGNRAMAEDVFQDAFLQVHVSSATFDAARRFRPWLFTIAANKARDALRRKTKRAEVDLMAPIGGQVGGATFVDLMELEEPGPEAGLDESDRDAMVQRALDSLPVTLREVLLLAYFQRLSYAQIADELGIPLGTVKSRLHSAVAAFADRWNALTHAGRSGRREDGIEGE